MDIIVANMADRDNATGVVGLVQAFVNTVDIQDGPEELSDPSALERWLVAHGLMESGQEVSGADVTNAIAVREAIRGVIGANTGATIYPLDIATLNGAAAASRLRARFGADGKARLEPQAGRGAGAPGAIGATGVAPKAGGVREPRYAMRASVVRCGPLHPARH